MSRTYEKTECRRMLAVWRSKWEESTKKPDPSSCEMCKDKGYVLIGIPARGVGHPFPGLIYKKLVLCDFCGAWRKFCAFTCQRCGGKLDTDEWRCTSDNCTYNKEQPERRHIAFFQKLCPTTDKQRFYYHLGKFTGQVLEDDVIVRFGTDEIIATVGEEGRIARYKKED